MALVVSALLDINTGGLAGVHVKPCMYIYIWGKNEPTIKEAICSRPFLW